MSNEEKYCHIIETKPRKRWAEHYGRHGEKKMA
jgi:hypothetical protein